MTLALLQARISSSRLPGKVLRPILGEPMLARQIERVRSAKRITQLAVATSSDSSDDPIAELCKRLDVTCFRGNLNDVLDRFYQAAKTFSADVVVRLTGDCPLTDPQVIDQIIEFFESGQYDYASNALTPTFPDGLDVEVMKFDALQCAWKEAKLPSEREHVTPFLYRKDNGFRLGNFTNRANLSHLRWTVDTLEDFEFVSAVYGELYPHNKNFLTSDILQLLETQPELQKRNSHMRRNEGLEASLKKDLEQRYQKSTELHHRALKVIPLGSQTFSKSKTQYPVGVAPLFISKGKGSRVWDVDGNEYVDFINSLCSITLGYNDPDVTKAVRIQLEDGVIFSLPGELETEVAEEIASIVPCAEMVRFGKNGSDATSGAIRLARAHTGRERVAVCGYHGWQDWYIGSTALHQGVPQAVRELTHSFTYNDIDSLHRLFKTYPDQFAAVILEPMNTIEPKSGFLAELKELAHKNGALLVFDETITGFRLANGGAQEYFGVTPDLATFGKGLANGYPVSAIAGRADLMQLMEKIFFSFTFGGELLSLAAAKATLQKLKREPVVKTIHNQGQKLMSALKQRLESHDMHDLLSLAGSPSWSFLLFKDSNGYGQFEIKTLFLQEVFARGILAIGTHNMSYAHSDNDIASLMTVYDEVFPIIKDAVKQKTLKEKLKAPALEPLFKIR